MFCFHKWMIPFKVRFASEQHVDHFVKRLNTPSQPLTLLGDWFPHKKQVKQEVNVRLWIEGREGIFFLTMPSLALPPTNMGTWKTRKKNGSWYPKKERLPRIHPALLSFEAFKHPPVHLSPPSHPAGRAAALAARALPCARSWRPCSSAWSKR